MSRQSKLVVDETLTGRAWSSVRGASVMFDWFKKKDKMPVSEEPIASEPVAHQPPNEVFPWPKGVTLTALDEVVIALPVAIMDTDRPMKEFIFGPDEMDINLPPNGEVFFIKLQPGMAVSLARSCQAYVVAGDGKSRRLKPSGPGVRNPGG